ncbi:Sec-independent protein translocase protein TatA [bioreactor metagenome]|uniref:Sec-independent protein translocase protein TatA n=1 Tax=bioreactor metagenome TaxID=1076179 RepID=A0A645ERA1_9ZZZZ
MRTPGLLEIVLVLIVVLLLFGPGRIGKVAGEIGSGIRNFRKNLNGEEEENKDSEKKSDDSSKSE